MFKATSVELTQIQARGSASNRGSNVKTRYPAKPTDCGQHASIRT